MIPGFFIGLAFRRLAIRYLNTGRDLRRMEIESKSPIFSDFQEALEGIVTIRAFSVERDLLGQMHQRVDATTKVHIYRGFTTHENSIQHSDVVFLLDGEPLATVKRRLPRCSRSSHHNFICHPHS